MNRKTVTDWILILLTTAAVAIIWFLAPDWIALKLAVARLSDEDVRNAYAARGQYGDQFGAINALFSGFAFAGIIVTLLFQRRDLAETRNVMAQERFDTTFFQLLNLHIQTSKTIKTRSREGQQAFEEFVESLKKSDPDFFVFAALQKIRHDKIREIIDTKTINKNELPELDSDEIANLSEAITKGTRGFANYLDQDVAMHKERVIKAYEKAALAYIDYFSHYFRNLYHLLKFVDESALISAEERKRYAKFIRAQLSDIELVCLFYNSLAPVTLPGRGSMELGYPKMQTYLKKYDMLQNMNPLSLVHPTHKVIFDQSSGNN